MSGQKSSVDNPIELFQRWFEEAKGCGLKEPTSVALATVNSNGNPTVRIVLLKHADERGFVFYTNLASAKGGDLKIHPHAAMCFHWDPLRKQVRVTGPCQQVSDDEADAYFATRARISQIGAWASNQSQTLEGRWALEKRVAHYTAKFSIGDVPRPSFWSGFRIVPDSIEFWEDRKYRLHDRFIYERRPEGGGGWSKRQLFP